VDHLQACIDFENIIFAGKALSIDGMAGSLAECDIGTIHKTHKLFNEGKDGNPIFSFIERQDYLMDLTKYECSLIVVTSTQTGGRHFDLPAIYKKSKNTNRNRKDNFSSLMLANWCFKLKLESEKLPDEEEFNGFAPMML